MMRFLHTADWHLGQRFLHKDRYEEHQEALNFIAQTLDTEQIDVLIVAGDIFDTSSPPILAEKMYYEFLQKVTQSHCRYVVIIGGNHDSPAKLEAPQEILKHLQIHVVGAIKRNEQQKVQFEQQIIKLENAQGLQAIIAAVPFLRDRDIKSALANETLAQRAKTVQESIKKHYHDLREAVLPYSNQSIPLLTTGHLFAANIQLSDSEQGRQSGEYDIHIGNLGQIPTDCFPDEFSYVALGHIHRPQVVGGKHHIRYAGSPIPLSFSERDEEKLVWIIDYQGSKIADIRSLFIPKTRHLLRFKGKPEALREQLSTYTPNPSGNKLTTWVEIIVQAEQKLAGFDQEMRELVEKEGKNSELVKISYERQEKLAEDFWLENDLEDLEPLDIFTKKCTQEGKNDQEIEALKQTFEELYSEMTQHD